MLSEHIKKTAASLDCHLSKRIYTMGQGKFRTYLKALEYSCHGIPWFVVVSILFYTTKNNGIYARLLIGLLFDIIYVAVIKSLCCRVRPLYGRQESKQMILVNLDKMSFPSGHASRAIYVAMFFSEYAGILTCPLWLWAGSVCLSRVMFGRHFLGDVAGGALLGYLNYVTQFSIFYPIHSFLVWFLMNVVVQSPDDYTF